MSTQSDSIAIKRAKCDSLSIYEMTEGELEIIKRGGSDLLFNIGVILISTFVSFLLTLLTVDMELSKKYYFFLFICIVTGILGPIMILLRRRSKNDFKHTVSTIEKRMKQEEKEDISTDDQTVQLGE